MSDEARLTRLQAEVDEARAMIRSAGITGFGSLTEGLAQLIKEGVPPKSVLCEIDDDEIATIHARVRSTAARLGSDAAYRARMAVRMEALRVVVAMFCESRGVDADHLLGSVYDIETSLSRGLREYETKERMST